MSSKVGRWRLRKRANRLVLREDNIDDASDSSDDDQIEPPRRLRFRYEDEAIVDANQLDPDPGSDSAASIDNNVIIDIIHDLNNESGMDEAPDYFDDADQRADEQPPDYFDDANQRADEQPPDYFDDANQRADEQVCANLVLGPVVNHRIDGNDDIADLNINDGIVNEGLSSDSEQPSDDDDNEQENVSEVSEEEGEEEERQEPNNRHLYPGAQLTFKESLIAILTFVLSHHLTGNSLIDLISLIILHCPMNSSCVKSLHYFKKIFRDVGKEIIVCHYFCSVCFKLLSQRNAACEQCNRVTGSSYFIEIPLLNQLQILFNRPGFYNQLQFRFLRQKKHANNIEDIYDGAIYTVYKEHTNNGFLSQPNHISFMWYTDGISVFNISKKFSIWPLYLVINELRYKDRVKKENILLAGIWFGKKKPKPNTYLEPLYRRMEEFSREGYLLNRPDGPPVRVKGMVLCGTCDMPAKSLFLRFKQFNGFYGCPKCLHKGEQYGTNVHIYPYSQNVPSRKNADIELYGTLALASGHPCYGVKGISFLFRLVPNMVRSTGIDSMHGAFSGLGKALLEFWFDGDHNGKEFSFIHIIDSVNARLAQIKVPSFLNKFPQTVSDLGSWKSLDYKVWLLYYSIPVLSGLMSDLYLNHHMLLVSAEYLLSQQSISLAQIEQAPTLLDKYVCEFQHLYGLRYMGINVHQLTHLSECVADLGPLWVYSCYFMEDLNGKICKFIHGTSHVGLQIASATTYTHLFHRWTRFHLLACSVIKFTKLVETSKWLRL
ncbi:Halomucin [Frankliniella fusca]|uniref:Halomucin n=1 Tax=Frankliniella fusca TaxID=407009 RepID=A0AAE1GVC5_9NEOP|nr:Halomucin [Frankliniella fusca]